MLGYGRSLVDTPDTDTIADTYTFTNFSHFGNGNDSAKKQPIYYCGMVNIAIPPASTWTDAESCMSTTGSVLMTSKSA